MKKIALVLIIFVLVSGAVCAFDFLSYPPPVEGGNLMIDVGLGLPYPWFSYRWIRVPPIFLHVEYALPVNVPISVGGSFIFAMYKYYDRYADFNIAARANWHWGFNVDKLDFYTGLNVGWHRHGYWPFSPGYQVGAHFYFSKNIGLNVEHSYPYWVKVGLALKF